MNFLSSLRRPEALISGGLAATRRALLLTLLASGLLAGLLSTGCDQSSNVRSTVPVDGEEDVDPRSSIRVTFSSTFNSNADSQENLTSPDNFQVIGEKGDRYKGKVEVKTRAAAALEASAVASGQAAATASTAARTDTAAQTTAEATSKTGDKKKNGSSPGRTDNDTLVFTLEAGSSFKPGERITVRVGGEMTVRGNPVDPHRFAFRVRGEDARPSLGDLRVASTSPRSEEPGVVQRPRISARFTQAVKPDGIAGAVTILGEHSGFHPPGETVFPRKESDQKILEVAQRLGPDDSFLPGEWVTVTLTSEIQGVAAAAPAGVAATGGTTSTGGQASTTGALGDLLSGGNSTLRLPAYTYRFQTAPGRPMGPWVSAYKDAGHPLPPDSPAERVVRAAAGNLRPIVDGTELVVVSPERVELFSRKGPGLWDRVELEDFGSGGGLPADAQVSDLDKDGVPELVLLTTRKSALSREDAVGSWVRTYLVGAAGGLVEKEDPLELPAFQAGMILAADLDNNGFTDLLVTHPAREYLAPRTGGPVLSNTGFLTILEKSRGAPDLTRLNPSDPTSLLGTPVFNRLENPLPELPPVKRVEAHDLDGDGKLELIVETAGDGLVLVQNRGTASDRFRFKIQRTLRGRGGRGPLAPRAWTAADVDADGDVDVLAWDETGALLYRNRLDPATLDPTRPEARGLLFQDMLPSALALPPLPEGALPPRALDLNGDRALDLVLPDAERRAARVLLGAAGRPLEFEEVEVASAVGGRLAALAIADLDGDTGLDLAVAGDGSGSGPGVEVILATQVEPPGASFPNSFSIDPELSAATENDIAVAVTADITESFTGYTVVLDYEEARLQFLRFEEPVNFRGVATFTPCPSRSGEGCAGFASVTMAFTQNSRGIKGEGVALGVFRFRPRTVDRAVRTSIFLSGDLEGPSKKLSNSLVIVDGQSQSEAQVELEGEPFVVSLAPPPPPLLAITACEVLELLDGVFPARVAWHSPADALFSAFQVRVDGELLQTLSGLARETEPFHINTGGTHPVQVQGVGLDGVRMTQVDCILSTVFQPDVRCSQVTVAGRKRNLINWSVAGSVDRFQLSKNGLAYRTVPGTVFSDEDLNASETSADVYEVAGIMEQGSRQVIGPPGSCTVVDPFPNRTEPPRDLHLTSPARAAPGDPIALRLSWTNSEAYDRLVLKVFTEGGTEVHQKDLSGTETVYLFTGDPDRGGVPPQIYRFSLVAVSGGSSSLERDATSFALPVVVPALGSGFTCEAPQGNEVRLLWDRVWGGYTGLSLSVKEPQGTREITLGLHEKERLDAVTPVGSFEYTLRARYDVALPASLRPNPQSLERRCAIAFRPLLKLGKVETGVGLENVLVPIRADLFAPVSGLRFALLLPAQLRVELPGPGPGPAVRLNGEHPGAAVTALSGSAPADDRGRPRHRLEVEVRGGAFSPGKDQTLLWVVGVVDPDFARAGTYPLRFDGPVEIVPQGAEGMLPIESDHEGAEVLIRKRFVVVDRLPARVTDTQPTFIRVLATFDKPAGFEKPEDYRVVGFNIHLKFDPELLDLQPITRTDQLETAAGSTGMFFYPQGPTYEAARRLGDLGVGWIGLLGEEGAITPGINQPLLFLKFLPRVPDNPAGALARIEVVKPPNGESPTMFVPEKVPNDGPVLEAFFDGGIDISPVDDIPTLLSVSPRTGALVGGGEAVVNGFGFLSGVSSPEEEIQLKLVYRPIGATPVERPVEWIPGRPHKNHLLEFRVPSSGLTSPSLFATRFDVELSTPKGRSILAEAFQYEYLRVTAADLLKGGVAGGDLVNITGFGFAPMAEGLAAGESAGSRVELRIRGAAPPRSFTAEVVEVAPDGRRLLLRTPAMPDQAGKLADLVVTVPTLLDAEGTPIRWASDQVPQPFTINAGAELSSLSPARGPASGGTRVTIEVAGFPRPLDGGDPLEVRFGAALAGSVAPIGPAALQATAPPGAAGMSDVSVRLGGTVATRAGAFEYYSQDPKLFSVTPAEGPASGGTRVQVKFAEFEGPGSFEALFGDSPASAVSAAGDTLSATTPALGPAQARGAVAVKVKKGALEASLPAAFLYREPRVLAVTPARGPTSGGTAVVITVDDFGTFAGVPQVRFGATAATVSAAGPGRVETTVPAASGPGAVDVTVLSGPYSAVLPRGYTYEGVASMTLTSVEPALGGFCGGEKVLLRGTGFPAGLRVRFGTELSPSVRVIDGGNAEATVPPAPETAGVVAVGLSATGAVFTDKPGAFTYRDHRPTFLRGDADGDGVLRLGDAVAITDYLNGARRTLPHLDAADVNDDGRITREDIVALTGYLFQGTGSPPPPSGAPGHDPTPDALRGCPP